MVFSNTFVDITISCRLFVFSQLRSKVSAGLSSASGLAVPAFDVVSILLPVFHPVCLCP